MILLKFDDFNILMCLYWYLNVPWQIEKLIFSSEQGWIIIFLASSQHDQLISSIYNLSIYFRFRPISKYYALVIFKTNQNKKTKTKKDSNSSSITSTKMLQKRTKTILQFIVFNQFWSIHSESFINSLDNINYAIEFRLGIDVFI